LANSVVTRDRNLKGIALMASFELRTSTREDDYQELALFQRQAFSADGTDPRLSSLQLLDYYRWKYDASAGAALTGRIIDNGKLTSVVAAVPLHLCGESTTVGGWQLRDIATHPEHRQKGHMQRLLASTISALPQEDVAFCFPNARSLPALLKSGMRRAGQLRLWTAPVLAMATGKPNYAVGFSADAITQPIPRVESSETKLAARLDQKYLGWRFARRPDVKYVRLSVRDAYHGEAFVRAALIGRLPVIMIMLIKAQSGALKPLRKAVAHHAITQGAWAVLYLSSEPWRRPLIPFFAPVPWGLMPRQFPIAMRPHDTAGFHGQRLGCFVEHSDVRAALIAAH
jgi:GNAT superfamily N-acetyltransferase